MKKKTNKSKEYHFAIKLLLCTLYLIIITILFVGSYQLFKEKQKIIHWSEVVNIEDYTYLDIYEMSEKFAYDETTNIGIHFIIEKEDTGLWHTYLIAIDENNYNKYQKIIDYTYERIEEQPKPIRVYGYPNIINNDLKEMAIKNLPNFLPKENEILITEENYEQYLSNSYLNTTIERKDNFSIILCISLGLILILIILFILTILDKEKK